MSNLRAMKKINELRDKYPELDLLWMWPLALLINGGLWYIYTVFLAHQSFGR